MLDVIDKRSATDSHPVPLLFVHGTWHAAWCWDEQQSHRAFAATVPAACPSRSNLFYHAPIHHKSPRTRNGRPSQSSAGICGQCDTGNS
jgi:hypothetical protein